MNQDLIAAVLILKDLALVLSTELDPGRKTALGDRMDEMLLVIKFFTEKMVTEIPP